MLYNQISRKIYCFGCDKWIELDEIYSDNEQIKCLAQDHIVGYEWDLPDIFLKEE